MRVTLAVLISSAWAASGCAMVHPTVELSLVGDVNPEREAKLIRAFRAGDARDELEGTPVREVLLLPAGGSHLGQLAGLVLPPSGLSLLDQWRRRGHQGQPGG